MYRAFQRSRLALRLRRLRANFGIAAPRVSVRTHVPWYWRGAAAVVVLALSLALAGWIYDAGRRYAGFDRTESESEIADLRDKAQSLDSELVRLRAIANASESQREMDKATIERLTEQVRTLEGGNIRLKEDLAVFENLASGGGAVDGFALARLRVEPESTPGQYRYRVLASMLGADAKREFKGALRFQVSLEDAEGRSVIMALPRAGDPDAGKFAVSFRAFGTLEGSFRVPAGSTLKRVEVRLVRDGSVVASQSVSL